MSNYDKMILIPMLMAVSVFMRSTKETHMTLEESDETSLFRSSTSVAKAIEVVCNGQLTMFRRVAIHADVMVEEE